MGPGDDERVIAAGNLFDDSPQKEAVARFLADPGHHLLIAYHDDVAVGFVSGVEVTHPDKGTEMFLYELGVDSGHRHHGIGTALLEAVIAEARAAGKTATISVEKFNPAQRLYRRLGFREIAEEGVHWVMECPSALREGTPDDQLNIA